ncbi:hypothetical protein BX265_8451 [Streptomyces sp. TLI_235]|nr:hypothetical protein BX265_8451 [Streptomyces sp. TLI_235]
MNNFDDIDITELSDEELDDIVGGQFAIAAHCVI